jgi:ADP-ribose pyrophosphatase YjhB (NUDIX family)
MIINKNSAKAVIIEQDKVLLQQKVYEDGIELYTLPGGTQEPGEPLEQAVVREVFEETAASINVVKLLHVYEHQRPSRKAPDTIKHKVEFAFLCELNAPYSPQNGEYPDSHQAAVKWVKIEQLNQLKLSPPILQQVIQQYSFNDNPSYLGITPSS